MTNVRVDVRDQLAYVTLDRPAKYNGLDLATLRELVRAAGEVRADRSVRVVILSGAGPAFCAGLDFASVGRSGPLALARAFGKIPGQRTNLFQRACWVWRDLPVPVIAVLHGHCFGGGLQLALAADFRITSAECELSVMEARWGLLPDMTGSVTLREHVGMDVAKRLAMTGEIIDGRQALAHGLVSAVADQPMKEAEALAEQLIARSPDALALTKRLLQDTWTRGPRRALWTESWLQARLMAGANHRIARAANAARELPAYVSRRVR